MSGQAKTNEYFLLSICENQISNRKAAEYRGGLFISNAHKGITGGNIATDMTSTSASMPAEIKFRLQRYTWPAWHASKSRFILAPVKLLETLQNASS